MLSFTEWKRDDKTKTITITCKDLDNTLEDLLNYIKKIGNTGHSFAIEVDGTKKFNWDINYVAGKNMKTYGQWKNEFWADIISSIASAPVPQQTTGFDKIDEKLEEFKIQIMTQNSGVHKNENLQWMAG